MRNRSRVVLATCATTSYLMVWCQPVIQGTVLDTLGEPVPMATVVLVHSGIGTTTQADGRFRLELPMWETRNDTLIIRCLGFQPITTMVGPATPSWLEFRLRPAVYDLQPVEVFARSRLPAAHELLKMARKSVKRNYLSKASSFPGQYRELLRVDGIASEVNEALVTASLTPYPSTKPSRRSFDQYWDQFFDFSKYTPRGPASVFAQHWPPFVEYNDHVSVENSRFSIQLAPNDGGYAAFGDPLGGPMDLVAMDNVKYGLHFLYPALSREYSFVTTGITTLPGGERCYTIEFQPKSLDNCYFHDHRKKIGIPLFQGCLWVSVDSHVVCRFKCSSVDWRSRTKPCGNQDQRELETRAVAIDYEVMYGRSIAGWVIHSVHYEAQQEYRDRNGQNTHLQWTRTLELMTDQIGEYLGKDESDFPLVSETLRSRYNNYDPVDWKTRATGFSSLSAQVQAELGHTTPIEVQYTLSSQPISAIQAPKAPDGVCSNLSSDTAAQSGPAHSYGVLEDKYGRAVLQHLINDQRRFTYEAHDLLEYQAPTNTHEDLKGLKVVADSTSRRLWLVDLTTLGATDTLLDLSQALRRYPNLSIGVHEQLGRRFTTRTSSPAQYPRYCVYFWDRDKSTPVDSLLDITFHCALDDSTLAYSRMDNTGRVDQILAHRIGSAHGADRSLLSCEDKQFEIEPVESSSKEFLFLKVHSKDRAQAYSLRRSDQSLSCISTLGDMMNIELDHFGGHSLFASVSRRDGSYAIVEFSDLTDSIREVYSTDHEILQFMVTNNELLLVEYYEFRSLLLATSLDHDRREHVLLDGTDFVRIDLELRTGSPQHKVLVHTESPGQPPSIYRFDAERLSLVKENDRRFGATGKKSHIVTEVIRLPSKDGIEVPVLISYDETSIADGPRAVLATVYGAYGSPIRPQFSPSDHVYLQKGYILADVGVRGSGVLGRPWYEAGRQLMKRHSFNDFESALTGLSSHFNVPSQRIFVRGTSAGGLIVAVCANEHPELFAGAVLDRPFLNVSATMADSSRYLVTLEYLEWGNPQNDSIRCLMDSYSPVENIGSHSYPSLFFRVSEFDIITPKEDALAALCRIRGSDPNGFHLYQERPGEAHMVRYRFKDEAEEFSYFEYLLSRDRAPKGP